MAVFTRQVLATHELPRFQESRIASTKLHMNTYSMLEATKLVESVHRQTIPVLFEHLTADKSGH